jgi:hypothetical protein
MKTPFIVLASLLALPSIALNCGGSDSSTVAGDDGGGGDDSSISGDGGSHGDAASSGDGASGGDVATSGGDGGGNRDGSSGGDSGSSNPIQTVFVIMMENHLWTEVHGSASAPYINNTLLAAGAHAEQYSTPPGNHPSEPNYIWLEAGGNLGLTTDNDPSSSNHSTATDHIVSQLKTANISWKAYAEDINGNVCPLTSTGNYAVKHTPMLFFDDVTNANSTTSAYCIAHVRPFTELATDLSGNSVARYNFITPNLCHDMHGSGIGGACSSFTDLIKSGDDWLAANVPAILASQAYLNNGALFIIWDEGSGLITASDGPVPFIVMSPKAKANYAQTTTHYTHSSMVRTVETIFGLPLLRDAANATDLHDLFTSFP